MGKKETRTHEEQNDAEMDNPKWMVLSIRKAFCWRDNGKRKRTDGERERSLIFIVRGYFLDFSRLP